MGLSGDWDQWIGGKIPGCTWPFCIPKDNPVDVDMWNQGYDDFMNGVFDDFMCTPKGPRRGLGPSGNDEFS